MIFILGTGYVAQAYSKYFLINSIQFRMIPRSEVMYTNPVNLAAFLGTNKPTLLINAAGYVGKPDEDNVEKHKLAALYCNAILPGFIGEICGALGIPWIHVSDGNIYDKWKQSRLVEARPIDRASNPLIRDTTHEPLNPDVLNYPQPRHPLELVESPLGPWKKEGYSEEDPPNFTFREYGNYYSSSKAMGEELIANAKKVYICRLRMPFNNVDGPRNYLTKLANEEKLVNASNSISQIDEFVAATYNLWVKEAPFGIYNATNPGLANVNEIVKKLLKAGIRKHEPTWITLDEFHASVKTPRANCLLHSSKIMSYASLTNVNEAIDVAISDWNTQ